MSSYGHGQITDPIRGASEPGRCWTLTNVAEATPDILSPLCWSVWGNGLELGGRAAWFDFGILPRREVRCSDDPNQLITASFFGRQAVNVDLVRTFMAGVPGTSADDFERDILGSVRPGLPPEPKAYRRMPFVAVKAPAVLATQSRRMRRLAQEQGDWWRNQVLARGRGGDCLARLEESAGRFQRAMHLHVRSRFFVQALQSQFVVLAERAGDPELAGRLLAGFGGVAETALADDLWLVSRGGLSRDEFLRRHGYHGPYEGNVIGRSWREDPATLDPVIEAMAKRPEWQRPKLQEEQAMAARGEAEAELLAALPAARRAPARLVCRLAAVHVRNLEVGKSCFLMGIDGCRAAARDLGAELVAAGTLDEIDDVFFFTIPELAAGVGADPRGVVAFRRARREEYRGLEIPVIFTGMPEPRPAADAASLGHEETGRSAGPPVTGIPGSAGVVEGLAKVVLEPGDGSVVEAGEILVCRFTDPSWAPLFTLADALVIDIGGPASHGAIVARELGVPCVIGTGDGTARIRSGDYIRVDGTAGVVEVISRGSEAETVS